MDEIAIEPGGALVLATPIGFDAYTAGLATSEVRAVSRSTCCACSPAPASCWACPSFGWASCSPYLLKAAAGLEFYRARVHQAEGNEQAAAAAAALHERLVAEALGQEREPADRH